MKIQFTQEAWNDFEWFLDNDKRLISRIREKHYFPASSGRRNRQTGTVKISAAGCWSRRITKEHRLVYKIEKDGIIVISCRYHE